MDGSVESSLPARAPPRMQFIVSSDTNKFDPVTRKLIRSHVMRGKKTKKPRAQVQARKPLAAPVKLQDVVESCAAGLPGRVGSDVSFVDFADEVEPSLLLKMIKSWFSVPCVPHTIVD